VEFNKEKSSKKEILTYDDNGECINIFFATNLKAICGQTSFVLCLNEKLK